MGTVLASEKSQSERVDTSVPVEVSVVIPCLNEANSLGSCIDKVVIAFRAAGLAGEVIVADNGSTDGSMQIAEERGARVVRVEERGYGSALRAGIAAARGPFIVMGDADDSYDFGEVPKFAEMLRQGYDVVMGNRFRGEIKPKAMPWHHKYIGNPGLTALLNLFFRTGIGDSHCGMRGFTRAVYERMDLRSTGMEFASEFVIKAAQLKARITEIPITLWRDKRGRPPHLRSFRDGWRHLRFMLLYAPNWLFLLPGGALLAAGLFLVFWLLPGPRQISPRVILDIHTMIFGVMFTLLGVQILSIGSFAKVFSYAERFDRNPVSLKRLLKRVKLETGLLVGGSLFLAGFAGCAWVAWKWAASGFGPLHEVRKVLFWSMWLFIGVQVTFASFFLSMLGISRGTYIGDYDLH
ncbi:MAG: glycosyltransferase family 2 protein [Acidobacteria bacterium Pan2503]|uniref:Glycosyltransferase family 2 protein n=1 Tax=Candidatus Acidiferrum panamense TaxID=2741543 RepID=A0A7V8NWH7_9BACT|nr:glycosyltransferase family 2 protein [Candidatus Acidoferrum panamensis]